MSIELGIKSKDECKYDAVSLGEVMLRLDPGEGRIRTARAATPRSTSDKKDTANRAVSGFNAQFSAVIVIAAD